VNSLVPDEEGNMAEEPEVTGEDLTKGPPTPAREIEPPKVATIPLTALPEELRDKSEAEIQFTLGRLISGVTQANERNRELSSRLEAAERVPDPEPEPGPHEGKTMAELFEEGEHEAAFDAYLEKKGYVGAVTDTRDKISSMEYDSVRREIADFDEHRDAVDTILKDRPNVDSRTVRAAYTMARGAATIAAEDKATRALLTPEHPDGDPPEPKVERGDMDTFEKEVFEASGMSEDRWHEMKGHVDIEVPLSGGRK
jgi:hypothetical protein